MMLAAEIKSSRWYRIVLFGRPNIAKVQRPAVDIPDAWRCTLQDGRPVIVSLDEFVEPVEEGSR